MKEGRERGYSRSVIHDEPSMMSKVVMRADEPHWAVLRCNALELRRMYAEVAEPDHVCQ